MFLSHEGLFVWLHSFSLSLTGGFMAEAPQAQFVFPAKSWDETLTCCCFLNFQVSKLCLSENLFHRASINSNQIWGIIYSNQINGWVQSLLCICVLVHLHLLKFMSLFPPHVLWEAFKKLHPTVSVFSLILESEWVWQTESGTNNTI